MDVETVDASLHLVASIAADASNVAREGSTPSVRVPTSMDACGFRNRRRERVLRAATRRRRGFLAARSLARRTVKDERPRASRERALARVRSRTPGEIRGSESDDRDGARSFANQARREPGMTSRGAPPRATRERRRRSIVPNPRDGSYPRFRVRRDRSLPPRSSPTSPPPSRARRTSRRPPRRRRSRWRRRAVPSAAIRSSPRPTRHAAWTRPRAPGRYTRWRERSRRKFRA